MCQNIAKHADANTMDPATHLDDAQPIGRYVEDSARRTIFKQYAEAGKREKSMTQNINIK